MRFEQIEDRVKQRYIDEQKLQINKLKILEMNSKTKILEPQSVQRDKIKGKFQLCLREDLSMRLKVAAFAQEPLSFHIHKNRQMFPKLQAQERSFNEKLREQMKELGMPEEQYTIRNGKITYKGKKSLFQFRKRTDLLNLEQNNNTMNNNKSIEFFTPRVIDNPQKQSSTMQQISEEIHNIKQNLNSVSSNFDSFDVSPSPRNQQSQRNLRNFKIKFNNDNSISPTRSSLCMPRQSDSTRFITQNRTTFINKSQRSARNAHLRHSYDNQISRLMNQSKACLDNGQDVMKRFNDTTKDISGKIDRVFQISGFFQEIDSSDVKSIKRLYDYKKTQIKEEQEEADKCIFSYKTGENDYSRMNAKIINRTFKKVKPKISKDKQGDDGKKKNEQGQGQEQQQQVSK
ncbi:UNKNOWN [Stylonychia lemnae]|uniref:Uncharacterized protein n=1 Tax=Stylonychia lemnae TaxID=5949 RepID=A0A078A932_STYLE|nr:UNKNOWN [Stylonychia lemnae]|eukprot:CDW78067.1 UNKNOWN [Stylonychia lemnae]